MRAQSSSEVPYEEKPTRTEIAGGLSLLIVMSFLWFDSLKDWRYVLPMLLLMIPVSFPWRRIVVTSDAFVMRGFLNLPLYRIKLSDVSRITPVPHSKSVFTPFSNRGVIRITYVRNDEDCRKVLWCEDPALLVTRLTSVAPHVRISASEEPVKERTWGETPLDRSTAAAKAFLLEHYRLKYPHNPEGVLAFHVDRLRIEGKTTKEAMLELKRRLAAD